LLAMRGCAEDAFNVGYRGGLKPPLVADAVRVPIKG
jgi:hypothetical protein